jgi:adenosylhomocysteine nucleosidase
MNPRKVYLGALKREVAPLVRYLPKLVSVDNLELWGDERCLIGYAGMGPTCATRAFQAVAELGPIASLTSVGWAGACTDGFAIGSVLHPSTIVNAKTGERFTAAQGDGTVVATIDRFADLIEKRRLNATYGASCVEMEAATLARLAEVHRIPFYCIKSISDTLDFELKGIERFHTPDGRFREGAFALFTAVRPWMWPAVMKMANGSKLAVENHCAEVERELKKSA